MINSFSVALGGRYRIKTKYHTSGCQVLTEENPENGGGVELRAGRRWSGNGTLCHCQGYGERRRGAAPSTRLSSTRMPFESAARPCP